MPINVDASVQRVVLVVVLVLLVVLLWHAPMGRRHDRAALHSDAHAVNATAHFRAPSDGAGAGSRDCFGAPLIPVVEQLSAAPVITRVRGLLSPREADYVLRAVARLPSAPSELTASGRTDHRTSTTTVVPHATVRADPVLARICGRIASYASRSVENLEPIQVTDYTHRQRYGRHHDYFQEDSAAAANQRRTSVFVYLKSVPDHAACGGATVFHRPAGALAVHGEVGDALMWDNVDARGRVDPRTLHEGTRIRCRDGHKVGLNAWFRMKVPE